MMAVKGSGSSAQSLTVLQRSARLYEGECWWLFDLRGEMRGLLLFDGAEDLTCLREDIGRRTTQGYRFQRAQSCLGSTGGGKGGASNNPSASSSRPDCQVTVEERTQLFGFLKKG
jgi:hypothetical protein